jgi:hypothetical protein
LLHRFQDLWEVEADIFHEGRGRRGIGEYLFSGFGPSLYAAQVSLCWLTADPCTMKAQDKVKSE